MLRETELTKCGITKGSLVEVSSDEEGFKGSLYGAILEETPSKSSRKKLPIRYLTLLTDDDFSPLRESVESRFIRPVPPEDVVASGEKFEEGDVVDASYRDGWWTGAVRKILADGRYVIYFDNPPDIIEFEGKDLRAHLDWIDGNWVRAEKQQLKKSAFSSGTTVELRSVSKDLCDAWVPAVVIKENEDGTVYVKYKPLRNGVDSEPRRSNVDSRNIRPTPLPCKDREYTLLEHVDVYCDSRWCEGVITRILAGKTYTVFFKSTNESFDFNQSDLRPSVEWKDGIWQIEPKLDIPLPAQSGHIKDNANKSEKVVEPEKIQGATQNKTEGRIPSKSLKKKQGDGSTPVSESYAVSSAKKMKLTSSSADLCKGGYDGEGEASVSTNRPRNVQKTTPVYEQAHHGLSNPSTIGARRVLKLAANGDIPMESVASIHKVGAREKRQVTGESGGKTATVATNGKSPVKIQRGLAASLRATPAEETEADAEGKASPEKVPKTIRKNKGSGNGSEGVKETEERKSSDDIHKRKRGRPRKFISLESCRTDQSASDQKTVGASANKDSKNVTEDDQPLNKWTGVTDELRLSSPSAANNSPVENQIGVAETPTADAAIVLPFVKRSPVWETVEAMEVFKIVPQRPHFSPLLETKEEYREGSAIGMMVTFSRLLEKVNGLQLDEPRSTLEGINECLLDVEKHGFNVTAPLCRINELLSIKDKQIQTLDRLKDVKREMEECDKIRNKCEGDIEGIRLKLFELQGQQAAMMKLKESMEMERARLQSQAATLDETIQDAEHEFQKTVNAPWNTTTLK